MNAIKEKTAELAALLKQSPEYEAFVSARERAFADESTRLLIGEYSRLQYRLRAAAMSGAADEDELIRLQKLGELLQLNHDASEFLFAQYRLNKLVTDVYEAVAKAVDIDLAMFDG